MRNQDVFVSAGLTEGRVKLLKDFYKDKSILVTGGASFIGSNLIDLLISLDANITIIDDFSSGKLENIKHLNLRIIRGDLRSRDFAFDHIRGFDVVFHLAAIHGGRGFIETYKKEMLANFAIDNNVFSAANNAKVSMVVHASSACAYPVNLQSDLKDRHLLSESEASLNSPDTSFADGVYGWTKIIGEYQLENFAHSNSLKGRSARIFTAYGERENESHAAIALIAKALLKADPYPVWGNGEQTRNFTYVADTAIGLLLLGSDSSEKSFDVFNVGTDSHVKVIDFVKTIFQELQWMPTKVDFQLYRPTGVASRASDNSKIKEVFGWAPKTPISIGIARTLNWYRNVSDRPKDLAELENALMVR